MKKVVGLLVSILCFLSSPAGVYGQPTESKLSWLVSVPPAAREARLAEAARKEGEVNAFASMDVAASKVILDGFVKNYPFVNARAVRFSGAAVINRLEAEAKAGKVTADVIVSGQLGIINFLDKNMLARYRSPQAQYYREGFKDKEGYWSIPFTNLSVTAYNTRSVKKDEVPRKLEDLLSPRWKGKMAMDTQSYGWFNAVLQHMGRERGVRFMKRLNEQDMVFVRGRRNLNQLLAAGEFEMAVETNLNSVLSISEVGAPIWFAPIQPLFLSPSMLFLSQNAPHPHAGALLIDYLLSEEGQRAIATTNRTPGHIKVKAAESRFLEGLEICMPDVVDTGKRYDAIGRQYQEIFPGAH